MQRRIVEQPFQRHKAAWQGSPIRIVGALLPFVIADAIQHFERLLMAVVIFLGQLGMGCLPAAPTRIPFIEGIEDKGRRPGQAAEPLDE